MSEYVIFRINGGMGKCIAATAVCQGIKKKYPNHKLIVVSGWSDVFKNLEFVDRYYDFEETCYFYDDYVKDKSSIIFCGEPYFQMTHIYQEQHLIKSWFDLFGLEYDGEQPVLKFTHSEIKTANVSWANQGTTPYMILQTCGGQSNLDYHWVRDMPQSLAQGIVNRYKDQYLIYHISRPTGYILHGAERVADNLNKRIFLSSLSLASKRVLIDSCLQHASKAMELESVVLWHGTDPKIFGYEENKNIHSKIPETYDTKKSIFYDADYGGDGLDCPHDDPSTIFNLNEIYNAIDGVENDLS